MQRQYSCPIYMHLKTSSIICLATLFQPSQQQPQIYTFRMCLWLQLIHFSCPIVIRMSVAYLWRLHHQQDVVANYIICYTAYRVLYRTLLQSINAKSQFKHKYCNYDMRYGDKVWSSYNLLDNCAKVTVINGKIYPPIKLMWNCNSSTIFINQPNLLS